MALLYSIFTRTEPSSLVIAAWLSGVMEIQHQKQTYKLLEISQVLCSHGSKVHTIKCEAETSFILSI